MSTLQQQLDREDALNPPNELLVSLRQMTEIVRRVQDALATHLDPGGNCDEREAISACLWIVDHKDTLAQQRDALAAIAKAEAAQ